MKPCEACCALTALFPRCRLGGLASESHHGYRRRAGAGEIRAIHPFRLATFCCLLRLLSVSRFQIVSKLFVFLFLAYSLQSTEEEVPFELSAEQRKEFYAAIEYDVNQSMTAINLPKDVRDSIFKPSSAFPAIFT